MRRREAPVPATGTVFIRLPPELAEEANKAARQDGPTLSTWVRRLVQAELERRSAAGKENNHS